MSWNACEQGRHHWQPLDGRTHAGRAHVEECSSCGRRGTWMPATHMWADDI